MKTKVVLICGLLTVLMCIAYVLTGCAREISGDVFIRFYVDPQTSVEYVLYASSTGAAICPRYNPDGSLYIKEE